MRQLLWTGMNILHHLTLDVQNPVSTVYVLGLPIPITNCHQARKCLLVDLAARFVAFDCLNLSILVSYSAPETRRPLLQRHDIQLQHRGPHQPLLTVEMRPTQCFVRQAPQAFHEGSIAFVQTWDAKQWEAPYKSVMKGGQLGQFQ